VLRDADPGEAEPASASDAELSLDVLRAGIAIAVPDPSRRTAVAMASVVGMRRPANSRQRTRAAWTREGSRGPVVRWCMKEELLSGPDRYRMETKRGLTVTVKYRNEIVQRSGIQSARHAGVGLRGRPGVPHHTGRR
jgi:hypothetical protein